MPQTRTHLILTSTHFTDEETKGQRSQMPKVIQPLGSSVWQTPGLRDCPHLQLRSEVPTLLREPPHVPKDTSYWEPGLLQPGRGLSARVSLCLTRPPVR